MTKKAKTWTAVAVAALLVEGWAFYVVSASPARWRRAMIVENEPEAHALYTSMIQALRDANSLSYSSMCSAPGGRFTSYQISLKKPNLFYVEVLNGMSTNAATLIADGEHLWVSWSRDRTYMALDDYESFDRTRSEIYVRKPAPNVAGSVNSEIADLEIAWYPTILDPGVFHGYADPLDAHIDGIRSRGPYTLREHECEIIEVSYFQAQRTRYYWISQEDHLPRMMKEIDRRVDNHVLVEEWSNLVIDEAVPAEKLAWEAPEGWQQWSPRRAEDFLLEPGQEAPDFELPSIGNGTISLSDYRSKVVWLCIWDVGSPACRQLMSYLQSLHEQHQDKGLTILGLNTVDNRRITRAFLKANGITFPIILDSSLDAQRIVDQGYWNKTGQVPLSYIIDREGKVVDAWFGYERSKRRGAAAFVDAQLDIAEE
jgi:peroxiredoxin/outer membrane lipoprotein-sorting protein